jgi:cysteinyl-tRNA synthetase
MTLRLYNTRTRQKEQFQPLDSNSVRMYVCGPTVYDYAHIGNARPLIVFDVFFRLLRRIYGEDRVVYARNITDVDDKINARAAEEGVSIRELTERTAAQFQADAAALGCLVPTFEPRATEYVTKPDAPSDMIRMIRKLIESGHAYEAEGHVLFSVGTDPEYGKLARRSVEEMRAGARVEVAPYKRDPMDFVLWKPSSGIEPGWESPWGFGRPGWHLECSAMSAALLGDVFDIHGGGIDLLFPHHENEVAQSTCAHGTPVMANVWMHNGHLQVEGAKMSKSLGNFVTIRDLLGDWPGEVIRFNMLKRHYRLPMDWTRSGLIESQKILVEWLIAMDTILDKYSIEECRQLVGPEFEEALCEDLNTHEALAVVHRFSKDAAHDALESTRMALAGSMDFLGLLPSDPNALLERMLGADKLDEEAIHRLIAARLAARKAKNWKEADRIRDELSAMGIALKDAKNIATGEIETTWEIAR